MRNNSQASNWPLPAVDFDGETKSEGTEAEEKLPFDNFEQLDQGFDSESHSRHEDRLDSDAASTWPAATIITEEEEKEETLIPEDNKNSVFWATANSDTNQHSGSAVRDVLNRLADREYPSTNNEWKPYATSGKPWTKLGLDQSGISLEELNEVRYVAREYNFYRQPLREFDRKDAAKDFRIRVQKATFTEIQRLAQREVEKRYPEENQTLADLSNDQIEAPVKTNTLGKFLKRIQILAQRLPKDSQKVVEIDRPIKKQRQNDGLTALEESKQEEIFRNLLLEAFDIYLEEKPQKTWRIKDYLERNDDIIFILGALSSVLPPEEAQQKILKAQVQYLKDNEAMNSTIRSNAEDLEEEKEFNFYYLIDAKRRLEQKACYLEMLERAISMYQELPKSEKKKNQEEAIKKIAQRVVESTALNVILDKKQTQGILVEKLIPVLENEMHVFIGRESKRNNRWYRKDRQAKAIIQDHKLLKKDIKVYNAYLFDLGIILDRLSGKKPIKTSGTIAKDPEPSVKHKDPYKEALDKFNEGEAAIKQGREHKNLSESEKRALLTLYKDSGLEAQDEIQEERSRQQREQKAKERLQFYRSVLANRNPMSAQFLKTLDDKADRTPSRARRQDRLAVTRPDSRTRTRRVPKPSQESLAEEKVGTRTPANRNRKKGNHGRHIGVNGVNATDASKKNPKRLNRFRGVLQSPAKVHPRRTDGGGLIKTYDTPNRTNERDSWEKISDSGSKFAPSINESAFQSPSSTRTPNQPTTPIFTPSGSSGVSAFQLPSSTRTPNQPTNPIFPPSGGSGVRVVPVETSNSGGSGVSRDSNDYSSSSTENERWVWNPNNLTRRTNANSVAPENEGSSMKRDASQESPKRNNRSENRSGIRVV